MQKPQSLPALEPFSQGERLRTFATTSYKTARALSERTGIDPSALSLYFSGQRSPGFRHLKALFEAGLSLDWLCAEETDLHLYTMNRIGSPAPFKPITASQMSSAQLLEELSRRIANRE